LEALLDNEQADKETTEFIFRAIDDLLIQLWGRESVIGNR
jgi:bilin biosynthesis PecE protein